MPIDAVQTFPWNSLETIPASNVAALGNVRRWAARHVRLEAFVRALSDLAGVEVALRVRRTTPRPGGLSIQGGVGLLLGVAGDSEPSATALVEVESALAAAIVSRVVRRQPPVVVAPVGAATDAMAGAFAAVLVAAARRAHAEAIPHVLAAGRAEDLAARFLRDGREALAVALIAVVGDDAYAARVLVARSEAIVARGDAVVAWTSQALRALGAAPLSVPVVACAARATLAELASLRAGDAWLPGTWTLARVDGSLRGAVVLAAPSSGFGVRAHLVEGGRLVLSGEIDAIGAGAGDLGEMTEAEAKDAGKDALLEAIGDVPVVVRVEIGEARMAARDWALLGKGDVVTLGRRVGELVVLRVGGVPVARGELVSVDGEVGVRIAERLGGAEDEAATETPNET